MNDNVVSFPGKDELPDDPNTPEDARCIVNFSTALILLVNDRKGMRRRAWDPKIQCVFFQDKQEVRLGDIIDVRVLHDHLPSEDIGIIFQPEFRILEIWRHTRSYTFTTQDILAHDWYEVMPDVENSA